MKRRFLNGMMLLDPEGGEPTAGALLLEGGRIAGRFPANSRCPEGAEGVDLSGFLLAPGFLDLHHHGGLIFFDPSGYDAALNASSASMLRHGTTAFLPTSVAWGQAELLEGVGALSESCLRSDIPGAQPLGVHLEGPWICPKAAGAQPRAAIRAPARSEVEAVLARGEGAIRMVTFAPEIPGTAVLQSALSRRNIVAALGHSHAAEADVEEAIAHGASHVTHLFNAMGPLHHRIPGLPGCALADERLTCDLICDGVHVHPSAVKMAERALGERLILITDRIELPSSADTHSPARHSREGSAPAGFGNASGTRKLQGQRSGSSFGSAEVREEGAAVRFEDGRLAGSCTALDFALRNLCDFSGATLLDAVAACTLRPAKVLGIEAERGTLRAGARADFAVLDDGAHVVETWIGGRAAFRARDKETLRDESGDRGELGQ